MHASFSVSSSDYQLSWSPCGGSAQAGPPIHATDIANARARIAVGQGAGGRTLTLKNPALARTDSTPKPFTANRDSFSLNAGVAFQSHQRDRLERL